MCSWSESWTSLLFKICLAMDLFIMFIIAVFYWLSLYEYLNLILKKGYFSNQQIRKLDLNYFAFWIFITVHGPMGEQNFVSKFAFYFISSQWWTKCLNKIWILNKICFWCARVLACVWKWTNFCWFYNCKIYSGCKSAAMRVGLKKEKLIRDRFNTKI